MIEGLAIALVAAIPATIAALAAWRSSARVGRQTSTGNGHTMAETVEEISHRIERLATEDKARAAVFVGELTEHSISDELHFAMLRAELASIKGGVEDISDDPS